MAKAMAAYSDAGSTSFIASDENRLVDLDETYEELDGKKANDVVSGLEHYMTTGRLSRRNLQAVGVAGCESYDISLSKMNGIYGGESFITRIIDGFVEFIKMIIEYIGRIINWCVSRIKTLLGFQKTSERIAESNAKRDKMVSELNRTLTNLGLDPNQYNFSDLINEAPIGSDRIEFLKTLKNKFDSDQKNIERLTDAIPKLEVLAKHVNETTGKLADGKNRVVRAVETFKQRYGNNRATNIDANNVIRELVDFNLKVLTNDVISKALAEVITILTDIKFDNISQLNDNLLKIRKELDKTRAVINSRVDKKTISDLYTMSSNIVKRIAESDPKALDISKVDPATLRDTIKLDDAKFMKEASEQLGNPVLAVTYQRTSTAVRDYLNLIDLTVKIISEVIAEIGNITLWKNRCDALIAVYITNDAVKIKEHLAGLKSQGVNAREGTTWTILKPDVNKLKEGISEVSQNVLNADIGNLRTVVNNFASQVGLGIKVE